MEAAVTAAQHGLRVRLVERGERVGGQLTLAAELRGKPQFRRLLDWYHERLAQLGVDVRTGTAAVSQVLHDDVDAILIATGGVGYVPPVPGSDHRGWSTCVTGCGPEWAHPISGSPSGAPTGSVCSSPTSWPAAATRSSWWGRRRDLAPDAGAREKLPAVERLRAARNVAIELRVGVEAIGATDMTCSRDGERFTLENPGLILASHGLTPAPLAIDPTAWGLPRERLLVAGDAENGASTIDHATASGHAAALAVVTALSGSS